MIFAVFNYQAYQNASIHNLSDVMAFKTISDAEQFFMTAGTGKQFYAIYYDVANEKVKTINRRAYLNIRQDEFTWMDLYKPSNISGLINHAQLKFARSLYFEYMRRVIDPQPFRRFTLGPHGGMVVTNNP